jgi:hypothetical protein
MIIGFQERREILAENWHKLPKMMFITLTPGPSAHLAGPQLGVGGLLLLGHDVRGRPHVASGALLDLLHLIPGVDLMKPFLAEVYRTKQCQLHACRFGLFIAIESKNFIFNDRINFCLLLIEIDFVYTSGIKNSISFHGLPQKFTPKIEKRGNFTWILYASTKILFPEIPRKIPEIIPRKKCTKNRAYYILGSQIVEESDFRVPALELVLEGAHA